MEVLDADGDSHFDVFDAEGRRLGRLATGMKRMQWAKPRLRNDRLYMVVRDDFDVERVVVFHVVKAGAAEPAR